MREEQTRIRNDRDAQRIRKQIEAEKREAKLCEYADELSELPGWKELLLPILESGIKSFQEGWSWTSPAVAAPSTHLKVEYDQEGRISGIHSEAKDSEPTIDFRRGEANSALWTRSSILNRIGKRDTHLAEAKRLSNILEVAYRDGALRRTNE